VKMLNENSVLIIKKIKIKKITERGPKMLGLKRETDEIDH